ncbi:hypothetical protein CIP107534_02019 [Corynebacterium diphtheriae]|nr:hypothetical protein CIP107534_02019 [Corynebacterium diphtheriae]
MIDDVRGFFVDLGWDVVAVCAGINGDMAKAAITTVKRARIASCVR